MPTERAQFQWKIPPGQVGQVIKDLQRQAPEQVYVAFTAKGKNIDRLGELLHPNLSDHELVAKSRIARISEEPAAARRAARRKDADERVIPLLNKTRDRAAGLAEQEEAVPLTPGPPITTERRLRAEVKKRIQDRLAAKLREDSEEAQSQPAVAPGGEGGRGSSPPRDMELFSAFASLLRDVLHPEPQPAQEAVSFRVTLVAPPASPTSQATTKPAPKQPSASRSSPTYRAEQERFDEDMVELFKPLQLGMSKGEILKLFPSASKIGVLVSPGQFADALNVTLPSGLQVDACFDPYTPPTLMNHVSMF